MKKSATILLVEDDRELSRLYGIRFRKAGFKVIEAYDGEEAVVKALAEQPDFIVLDLMLPKQGGIQVLRILKSNNQTKDIPVLVLTAYDHFNYRRDSQAHIVDFLLKTEISPQKMVEIVQKHLKLDKK